MKLFNRLIVVAMATASIAALAIPATASASNLGSVVKGTELTMKNIGAVTLEEPIPQLISCPEWSMAGEVAQNGPYYIGEERSGTSFTIVGKGEGSAPNCMGGEYGPATFRHILLVELTSHTSGIGSGALSFEVTYRGWTCKYSGREMPFTYVRGSNEIKFTNAQLSGTSGACFGNARFSGTFGVYLPNGNPVTIN